MLRRLFAAVCGSGLCPQCKAVIDMGDSHCGQCGNRIYTRRL
jgi:predicted amidophosphoribosyltransferase